MLNSSHRPLRAFVSRPSPSLFALLCVISLVMGCSAEDAGTPPRSEAGSPVLDGSGRGPDGSSSTDASTTDRSDPIPDGAAPPPDGTAMPDVTVRPDGGTTIPDGATTTPDGGTTIPDGGTTVPDTGTTPDAGPRPDGGTTTPDGGTSLDVRVDSVSPPADVRTDVVIPDGATSPDAGGTDGGAPGTFKLFDQIPQFGMYVMMAPNYTPPAGVLMWSFGTVFLTKLTPAHKGMIGSDLKARVTYHAQCDNYDRLGGLFFIVLPTGQAPTESDQRTELARFITPFSNYTRGALATYVFPLADISTFASVFSDPAHDVWIGIAGGSNPYTGSGDPCPSVAADFKAVGFKYSLEFVSTSPLTGASSTILTALYYVQAASVPVTSTFTNNSGGTLTGRVTVIVTGHGSAAGGNEYMNTQDTVTLNGTQIGSFSTMVNCASYEQYSPDGNPGIFRNNTTSNPRNWCPGELIPPRSFPATLNAGSNSISLGITPSTVPSGSYYPTSFSFSSP